MNVYIPSYLGSDPKTIAKRLKKHNEQLAWILQCSEVQSITVCSQGYPANAKVEDPRVHYLDAEPLGPSHARNLLLRRHYASGNSVCLFIDNDISSKKHGLLELIEISRRLSERTQWHLLGFVPHGFGLRSTPPEQITFTRKSVFASGMFFLSGITDHFFDEEIQHMEDVDYMFRLMLSGHSYYEITEYEFFEHSYASSVIYEGGNRKEEYAQMRAFLKAKHKREVQELGHTSVKAYIDSRVWPKSVQVPLSDVQKSTLF